MNSRNLVLAAGVGILLVAGFLLGPGRNIARGESPQDLKGKAAPDFTLKTVDGKDVTLSSLKGKVVVVDFWATWCPPCRKSLPHIQKLSADTELHGKGLRVLAVNARENKGQIEHFLDQNKYNFKVAMDSSGDTMAAYHVEGIPTTLIIGRDGIVRDVYVGFTPGESEKAADEAIAAALK